MNFDITYIFEDIFTEFLRHTHLYCEAVCSLAYCIIKTGAPEDGEASLDFITNRPVELSGASLLSPMNEMMEELHRGHNDDAGHWSRRQTLVDYTH